jgi:hypothetical protein
MTTPDTRLYFEARENPVAAAQTEIARETWIKGSWEQRCQYRAAKETLQELASSTHAGTRSSTTEKEQAAEVVRAVEEEWAEELGEIQQKLAAAETAAANLPDVHRDEHGVCILPKQVSSSTYPRLQHHDEKNTKTTRQENYIGREQFSWGLKIAVPDASASDMLS